MSDYTIYPINITAGDQFQPDFLKLSPNNRMPAIVDHDPIDNGQPLDLFESGAILLYLAERTGKFYPTDLRSRYVVTKWLMWQMVTWSDGWSESSFWSVAPIKFRMRSSAIGLKQAVCTGY